LGQTENQKQMKLLALCDSPTLTSGFARVAQNLFQCWAKRGVQIDCFGICFNGWNYRKVPYVNQLFPAGDGGEWCQPKKLEIFLKQLSIGGYTHVWIMQDTFLLSGNAFPESLQRVCREKNIKSMLYFPVDAPLDPEWTDIIAAVDIPVAYTQYGAADAIAKCKQRSMDLVTAGLSTGLSYDLNCAVLPHGVNSDIYGPLHGRQSLRHELYSKQPWLKDDDFVMINVNANQCRKDIPRSLEILAGLVARGVPAKLILHMPENGGPEQNISIDSCARQLGLRPAQHYGHHNALFRGSQSILPETTDYSVKGIGSLVGFYNLADLYLTTTLGEGWGLPITEALACGTPVAMPEGTACGEIGKALVDHGLGHMRCLLPLEYGTIVHRADNSRMRHRVYLSGAVDAIEAYYKSGQWRDRVPIGSNKEMKEWLSWDRVAGEMLQLFKNAVPVKASARSKPAPAAVPDANYAAFGEMEVCK